MGAVKWLRRGGTDVAGAAAIEFAIVLPLLMLLVLGGLDWGYYFFIAQVTTNAAREGARAGSLEVDAAAATTRANDAITEYFTRAGLDPARATRTIDPSYLVNAKESVRVDLTYPAGSLTGFIQVIVPASANASAVMRRL